MQPYRIARDNEIRVITLERDVERERDKVKRTIKKRDACGVASWSRENESFIWLDEADARLWIRHASNLRGANYIKMSSSRFLIF